MYKKVIATSIVAASLFLTGCGEESTNCRFDVQSDLDQGNFDNAIAQLDGACASAFTPSDRYFNLATAYMGKAGFGALDVVSMVLDSDSDDGDAFASLTRSIDEKKNDASLELLSQAQTYYLLSIQPDANVSQLSTDICNTNTTNSRVENACFYIGFNQTFQAVTTITQLTNDVDSLVDSINDTSSNVGTPDDMQASLDALAWATGTAKTNVTPSDVTINGSSYAHLVVTEDNGAKTFYRLAKSTTQGIENSTILTSGYCTTDGNSTACDGIENEDGSIDTTMPNANSCYACPIVTDDNNTQDVAQLLVDTLNGGTTTLSNVTDDEDIKESIDQFVQDVTGDENAKAGETKVTIQQILDYLNK